MKVPKHVSGQGKSYIRGLGHLGGGIRQRHGSFGCEAEALAVRGGLLMSWTDDGRSEG